MRMEELENRMTEATYAKNSEGLATGTISGQETAIKDDWDSDELEEENIMDGNKGKIEELANDDEKARDMENTNTNRNIGGIDKENSEGIKPSNGQENQEIDERHVASEAEAKENTTVENKDTGKVETKGNNLNTTNTPDTDGLSLFGVEELEMRTNK